MKDFIAFFGEFIVVIAVGGMFYAMAPDGAQKKYIHFAISLCVLAAIMGPMISVVSSLPEMLEEVEMEVEEHQVEIEENLTEAVISASRENMEASIIALLSQKYDIATEKLAVSVALDAKDPENIEIVSIDVRAEGISSAKREEMRRYLAEQFLGNLSITVSD
ncbi:MAG: stage III sporulation protein AF [Clostridia bacterium]|nr:stage III sporulation protein AF [Clostridia bacterium]